MDDHRAIGATPTEELRSRSLEAGTNSTGALDRKLTGAQKRFRPVGLQHANRMEHSGLATAGRSDDEVETRKRTGLELVYPPKILDAKPAQEDVLATGSRRNQGRNRRQSERTRLIGHDQKSSGGDYPAEAAEAAKGGPANAMERPKSAGDSSTGRT